MGRILNKRYARSAPTKSLGIDSTPVNWDGFGRKREPVSSDLVRKYKRFAYSCANMNSNTTATVPLRLYLKTDSRSEKSILRKGIELSPVEPLKKEYLSSLPYLQKTLRSFQDIEEVVVHPVIDLLETVNDISQINGHRLRVHTQLYQEITGKAYWFIDTDAFFGIPQAIWLLPSQYVRPVKEYNNSRKLVDYYEYTGSTSGENPKYRPEDIVPFLRPSVSNPYLEGVGFLQAAFEDNEVNNKLIAHENAYLENEGRPDAILTPRSEESIFGDAEARRFEREYRNRFGRGRGGGLWVVPEDVALQPLNFPPRDLARLELNKWTRLDIANAADIPINLMDGGTGKDIESAERQYAKYGIRPRLDANCAVLNDQIIPRFDDSGRLFLAYDDPVPEDVQAKQNKITQFVMNGIWTRNEGRKFDGIYGEHDDPEADQLVAINVSPEIARDEKRKSGNDKSTNKGKDSTTGATN